MIAIQTDFQMELQEHYIQVSTQPAVEIKVLEGGTPDAETTIVFLHGFGGWASHWTNQFECFEDSSRNMAIELRGHSGSDKPPGKYEINTFLDDFEIIFEELEVKKPFILVGHSFGALLASEYALKHPAEVEQLILFNPSIKYSVGLARQILLAIPNFIFDAVVDLLNRIRIAYLAPSYVLKSIYWNALHGWKPDVYETLKIPTLIFIPLSDPVFSRRNMEGVGDAIENSQTILLPTRSHMTMIQQAPTVNREMAEFVGLPSC
jgi:long-chain acyl-CoA synthetase